MVYFINSDENLALKPLKVGLREETEHQNYLKRSFIKGEAKQVVDKEKVELVKIISKQEELLQFSQLKQTNTAAVTTTDSDDDWWEEEIGNACTVPSHVISKEKMKDDILVDTRIPLKEVSKKPMKTITSETQLSANTTPQPIMTEQRVHRTSLADNFLTLLQTPTAIDSDTLSSHRWSTPVGKN